MEYFIGWGLLLLLFWRLFGWQVAGVYAAILAIGVGLAAFSHGPVELMDDYCATHTCRGE